MRFFLHSLTAGILTIGGFFCTAYAEEEPVVHVYNWSDYIAKDTLENFTKKTGIKVVYDVFDSNEVLEAKLLAGNSGYDIVVPTASFLGRQILAGVFQKLDRRKLVNFKNLDPNLMKILEVVDPGNEHSFTYLWGTTGIGYNVDAITKVFGDTSVMESWDAVFKPENIAKLKSCGVSLLDAPSEIMGLALHYQGMDPNSLKPNDYSEAAKLLTQIRPYIRYFHSSQYINDLANGDICMAIGWSGDILQARARAEESGNGVKVAYSIPKEGTIIWFDMMAIPKDAPHPENAHKFLNFILRPDVIANISNYVSYANGNKASQALIDEEIINNLGIYPSEETMQKLYTAIVLPPKIDRVITRNWTKVKTGR